MFQEVHNYQELRKIFNQLETEDWVVFDVDEVLTVPSNPAFQTPNVKSHRSVLSSTISDLSVDDRNLFFNLALINHKSLLLDPYILELLESLKDKNIHTVALTAVMNGPVGTLQSMAHWRYEQLKSLGIEFIHPSLKEEILFNNLPSYKGFHPSYYKGILFQNSHLCSKGDVLKEYFECHSNHPKQIVMIDDRDYNLESVSNMLSNYYPNIKYHGIWLKVADHYCCKQVDKKTAKKAWNSIKDIIQTN